LLSSTAPNECKAGAGRQDKLAGHGPFLPNPAQRSSSSPDETEHIQAILLKRERLNDLTVGL